MEVTALFITMETDENMTPLHYTSGIITALKRNRRMERFP